MYADRDIIACTTSYSSVYCTIDLKLFMFFYHGLEISIDYYYILFCRLRTDFFSAFSNIKDQGDLCAQLNLRFYADVLVRLHVRMHRNKDGCFQYYSQDVFFTFLAL